jgi:hypothetical protein
MFYIPKPSETVTTGEAVVEAAKNGYLRLIELMTTPDMALFLIDQNVGDCARMSELDCEFSCVNASRLRVSKGNIYNLE